MLLILHALLWAASAEPRVQAPPLLPAQVAVLRAPQELRPGGSATALLEVRNVGPDLWPAGGPVRIVSRWVQLPAGAVSPGSDTELASDVAPGGRVTVCAAMEAPQAPGDYLVEWTVGSGPDVRPAGDRSGATAPLRVRVVEPVRANTIRLKLALFFSLTISHFILSVVTAGRWSRAPTVEAVMFQGILLGVATLSGLLHLVAMTVGLSFLSGTLTIAIWQILLLAAAIRLGASERFRPSTHGPIDAALSGVAIGVVVLLMGQWFSHAISGLEITGTDAAHYHAPNAVNIARGLSPLDFAATPHLYPLAGSVLASWFIAPLDDPLLIDLSTIPAFLLAWVSVAYLFRCATAASGFAWGTWLLLLLMSSRLFEVSRLFSADLLYAAAFLALNAQLFTLARRGRVTGMDLCLVGAALGLLVGSKTTGLASAVFLLLAHAALHLCWHGTRLLWDRRGMAVAALPALLLFAGAGGVWLVRNWMNYGSPLAPNGLTILGFEIFPGDRFADGRLYLSVLGDMQAAAGYPVSERAALFLGRWIGTWFVPSLLLVVVVVIDGVRGLRKPDVAPLAAARLGLVFAVFALTISHVWLLAQAPWTSLEWTRGSSLRYILPLLVVWPLLAYLALFPITWPWWHRLPAWRAWQAGSPEAQVRQMTWPPRVQRRAAIAVLVVLAAGIAVEKAVAADMRLRSEAADANARLRGCDAEAELAGDPYRLAYLQVLDHEQRAGPCRSRRFFVTTRFDSPMALQPVPFRNIVIDARPRSIVERSFKSDGPGTQRCDYVVALEAELNTTRGNLLVNDLKARGLLTRIGSTGRYTLFGAERK